MQILIDLPADNGIEQEVRVMDPARPLQERCISHCRNVISHVLVYVNNIKLSTIDKTKENRNRQDLQQIFLPVAEFWLIKHNRTIVEVTT